MNLFSTKKVIAKEGLFYVLSIFLLIIFIYLHFNIWYGENSYTKLLNLKKDIREKQESNIELARKNLELEEEKNKLVSGKSAIEGIARYELGLIKPGEVFYKFQSENYKPQESNLDENNKDR